MPRSEALQLIDVLRSKGIRMSAAESCTGGMIGCMMTSISGSSDVFLGSAVTYSNESKERILGVSHQTLLDHGAVSEETAREMAKGAIDVYGSDVSLAVTGIAGPGGATPEKPVGLVYIAVADGPRTVVTKNIFEGDRQAVRKQTAVEALKLLKELAEGRL
ncbi:MAG: CinA family protein [Candidatus Methanomethylophilaceae archaeon]|nr:CinA family protein [Candidatus Methanomethylophilaceae archaeon]MBP5734863.1 CinA family protein [Candidatus Methanomethylophilaceae archaeon]